MTAADLDAMAHSIAYSTCRSDIESLCDPATDTAAGERIWWHTLTAAPDDAPFVADAVAYLDARGLIERDPANSNIVRICDEPEPGAIPLLQKHTPTATTTESSDGEPFDLGPWPFDKVGIEVAA